MDDAPTTPAVKGERPWWVPLVGLGSLCLGGVQALGGALLLAAAASAPPGAAGTFTLGGLAWLIPGGVLGVSGLGVLLGRSWARGLTLVACGVWALALGAVAADRAAIPVAIADWVEHLADDPELKGSEMGKRLDELLRRDSPVELLRDPGNAATFGWVYTGYCACPVLPWYLFAGLLALVPAGRRLGQPVEPRRD